MMNSNVYGVSATATVHRAGFLRVAPHNFAGITRPAHTAAHARMAAHAPVAVAAIAPQRKRPSATTTEASVNRGFD